jgi:hypothetical protein
VPTVSGTFEFVSREAVTFPRRPRPTAPCRLGGSMRHERGAGGLAARNRWGETGAREPPDEPCPMERGTSQRVPPSAWRRG